ncbi:hypothetical protein ACS0TY_005582 [Phlomoides rotata]
MESKQKEKDCPSEEMMKNSCSICKTTETPLWRSGPFGPKSLCNACGIKFSKKRPHSASSSNKNDDKKKIKVKKTEGNLKPLGKDVEEEEVVTDEEWSEVERAALLLMALSCGVVFK